MVRLYSIQNIIGHISYVQCVSNMSGKHSYFLDHTTEYVIMENTDSPEDLLLTHTVLYKDSYMTNWYLYTSLIIEPFNIELLASF